MSQQYTFEIENFNNGRNLVIDVQSAIFPEFPSLSAGSVGTTIKTAEKVKKLTIIRSFDHSNSSLFTIQIGKSFPKAVLRINSSSKGKSYLFTFLKVFLVSYNPYNNAGDEILEEINFYFDEFSVKEDSPAGNTSKPNRVKTSDKQQAAAMNFVKG